MKATTNAVPGIAGIIGAVIAVVGGDLISNANAFGELNVALRAAIGFIPSFLLAKILIARRSNT